MSEDFRQKFKNFSEKMVRISSRCKNVEATKMFLILPFLQFLGYDITNPDEVCPEHHADFSDKYKNKVDYAILRNHIPVIAIECKALGTSLKDERGQLKSYFNAAQTIKLGVITDGLIYEFYADSDEPNIMDMHAFLTFDLNDIAKGKIEDSVVDGLKSLQKTNFDPENIGAEAKRKIVFQNLVQQIEDLSASPSEDFVRILLQNIGIKHARAKAMTEYTELTKSAFREFVNIRILERLDLPQKEKETDKAALPEPVKADVEAKLTDVLEPTKLENDVFEYVKSRLAFLSDTEDLFKSIQEIGFKNFKGKFVVFYKKERAGRMFDFYEGKEKTYTFDFGEQAGGEISTDNISDIDDKLLSVFREKAEALGYAK